MTSTIQCPTPVAILMAAYNAEKYIVEQIESIIAQTSSEWTLYIRNDGSKDGTQSIIDSYVSRYPEKIIQIDKGGENLGCNKNFYRLLETVEADYYMFADSDDYWISEKVTTLLNEIKKYEIKYDNIPILINSDMSVCDERLNIVHHSLWESMKLKPSRFNSFNLIMATPIIGGSTSIFNRLAKKYIFPVPDIKGLMYDHWIGLCVIKNGKIFHLPVPLQMYRQHNGQVCGLEDENQNLFSYGTLKAKMKNWKRSADIFYGIGVPRWKFYLYKIISNLRK